MKSASKLLLFVSLATLSCALLNTAPSCSASQASPSPTEKSASSSADDAATPTELPEGVTFKIHINKKSSENNQLDSRISLVTEWKNKQKRTQFDDPILKSFETHSADKRIAGLPLVATLSAKIIYDDENFSKSFASMEILQAKSGDGLMLLENTLAIPVTKDPGVDIKIFKNDELVDLKNGQSLEAGTHLLRFEH
ncbi:MAG: hypothetical protein HUJ26_03855 [Planctomycetaceae bacterium]|nr:hypothetical protein [Planctomycetaceae bacterium]